MINLTESNPEELTVTELTRRSPFTGKQVTIQLNMKPSAYLACYELWQKGAKIQDAFPMLSADEREFILTGISAEEWYYFVGEEDDSDEG